MSDKKLKKGHYCYAVIGRGTIFDPNAKVRERVQIIEIDDDNATIKTVNDIRPIIEKTVKIENLSR